MVENILVPFDGSPLSEKALEYAITKHPNNNITVLCVINPFEVVYETELKGLKAGMNWQDKMSKKADKICEDARKQAKKHNQQIQTEVKTGNPAQKIIEYIDKNSIEHIIMGSHGGSSLSKIILGSTTEKIIRRSSIPVTIIR